MVQTKTPVFKQRLSTDYRQTRSQQVQKQAQVPQIHLFDLSLPEEWDAFIAALEQQLRTRDATYQQQSSEAMLCQALTQELLVDRFELYLEDYFKLKREKHWWEEQRHGQVLARAIQLSDRWENSVIAEYTWEQQRRFVRLPPEDIFYEIAYSRNRHIFSPQLQSVLRQEMFAIDGLGVGSAIAYLLVLCGAQHFIVADGGAVTLHDHNRLLGADVRESGLNHAIHWTRLALKTNPYLHIHCHPGNLSVQQAADKPGELGLQTFLDGARLVIEEADNLLVKAAVRKAAKVARIPVFMGADLGKGGQVQYESPDPRDPIMEGRFTDEHWQELQHLSHIDFERLTQLVAEVFVCREDLSAEFQQALVEAHQAGTPFWPQVGLGAFASTRGTVEAILSYLEGKPPHFRQALP